MAELQPYFDILEQTYRNFTGLTGAINRLLPERCSCPGPMEQDVDHVIKGVLATLTRAVELLVDQLATIQNEDAREYVAAELARYIEESCLPELVKEAARQKLNE